MCGSRSGASCRRTAAALVTAFLTSFFERYVEYNFTADLENQLDDVSGGRVDWKKVLRDFWRDFSAADRRHQGPEDQPGDRARSTPISARISSPTTAPAAIPRLCPVCGAGRLGLKLGKFGAFIGCSNYPDCRYTRPLAVETDANGGSGANGNGGPKDLGRDPGDRRAGDAAQRALRPLCPARRRRQRRASRSAPRCRTALTPADVDLDTALRLLALPRELGRHPETGRADHRRDRPLRSLSQAWVRLRLARPATTMC